MSTTTTTTRPGRDRDFPVPAADEAPDSGGCGGFCSFCAACDSATSSAVCASKAAESPSVYADGNACAGAMADIVRFLLEDDDAAAAAADVAGEGSVPPVADADGAELPWHELLLLTEPDSGNDAELSAAGFGNESGFDIADMDVADFDLDLDTCDPASSSFLCL